MKRDTSLPHGAGIHELRLAALHTRQELAGTLDLLERRLDPILRFAFGVALTGLIGWVLLKFRDAKVRPATGRPYQAQRIRELAHRG